MADTVTADDVKKARTRVDKLREQVAEERAKIAANAVSNENAVRVAQLETEERRLKAEFDALKEANKASTQRALVKDTVESVTAGTGEGQPADIVPAPSVAEAYEDKES